MTNTNDYRPLREAAAALSARCDGAITDDGVGWNATDTHFGKSLVLLPLDQWDDDIASASWEMMQKYKTQLEGCGVHFDTLPHKTSLNARDGRKRAITATYMAKRDTRVSSESKITLENDIIVLKSIYHDGLLVDVRAINGRSWNPSEKVWTFPKNQAQAVMDLASKWGIASYDEDLQTVAMTNPAPAPQTIEPNLIVDDGVIEVRFPYDSVTTNAIRREVPGVVWVSSRKCWTTSYVNIVATVQFAHRHNLRIADGVEDEMRLEMQRAETLHKASSALDADINIPSAIPLLPYQRAGVAYLLKTRRAMLCDEMGLGKSVQALAAVMTSGCYPVVVVCPNTLKLNWGLEVEKFFPGTSVTVVSGTASAPIEDANIIVVNYDIVAQRADDIIALSPEALIADEAHAIKNGKAKYVCPECGAGGYRADSKSCGSCHARFAHPKEVWSVRRTGGVMNIARSIPDHGMVLLLSGTPITNRPIELVPQLIAIDQLKAFGGRWKFQNRYAPSGTGAANLVELNNLLRSRCFIRRTQKDVLPELPPLRNAKQAMSVDPSAMVKYKKIEADVIEHLARRAFELAEEMGEDPMSAYWEKRMRAEAAEHLVRISVLKDAVTDLKKDSTIAWIKDFLDDTDEKVVVFAEHIKTVESVYKEFESQAVKIRGGVSQADRALAVQKFQTDPNTRVFVGNMAAASEGLTLTAAHNVVFLEQGWTPAIHAQCAARCHGRANDPQPATAWYLLAPRTIDQEIFALLEKKKVIIDAATDGKEITEPQTSILADLVVGLARRGMEAV